MIIYFLEVETYGLLSQGKPSKQSSTYANDYKNYKSDFAFDGNLKQVAQGKRVYTHTNADPLSWLQADLIQIRTIEKVRIYNRLGFNSKRLQNASIDVSEDEKFTKKKLCVIFSKITNDNQVETFNCATLLRGRYVRLSVENTFLHVCEMQVFGFY